MASPGATNICLMGSLQSDLVFEIYSSVDERSAAFIAVELVAESGGPVAFIVCGSHFVKKIISRGFQRSMIMSTEQPQILCNTRQNLESKA